MTTGPLIFFDLDGTLTDPKAGITRCIQYALEGQDVPVPSADDLEWCIGPPLRDSFVHLLDEARADAAVQRYRERYATLGWAENVPYAGIQTLLASLCEAGASLYVATSKPHVFASQILEHFELLPFFERVFGAELDGTRGTKTELLAFALAEVAASKGAFTQQTAHMVGDRRFDMEGARAHNLHAVGVTYGYGSSAELQAAGAQVLASSPADLLPILLHDMQTTPKI